MDKSFKVCLTVNAFLKHPDCSMIELSKLPELEGISKSSVQRYLNDPVIIDLFGKGVYDKIQRIIDEKTQEARVKGGINSFKNNQALKSSKGQFIGNIPLKDDSKVERKINHIIALARIFLTNPSLSLQEIADLYNSTSAENDKITRDYVYDCLTSEGKYDILSKDVWNLISEQLVARRIVGNRNGSITVNENKIR